MFYSANSVTYTFRETFILLIIFSGRMNWTKLIIIIMSSHSSQNIKQTMQNDQLVFNGFDCRTPKKVVPFLTKVWCQPEKKLVAKTPWGERTVTLLHKGS